MLALIAFLSCDKKEVINEKLQADYRIYHQLINDAEIALLDGSFSLADHNFKAAFAYVPRGFKHDYLLAGINAQRLSNTEQAFIWLDSAALLGLTAETWELDTAIYLLQEQPEWQDFLKRYDRLHEIYQSKLHPEVVKTVAWLDSLELAYQESHGTDSVIDYKWFYQTNHDSLVSLINRYGWPGITLAGDNTLSRRRQWYVIQHRETAAIKALEAESLQAIIDGELYPFQYAFAYEIKYMTEGLSDAIGKMKAGDLPPEPRLLYGVMDVDGATDRYFKRIDGTRAEVEGRRRALGLCPVADQALWAARLTEPKVYKEVFDHATTEIKL